MRHDRAKKLAHDALTDLQEQLEGGRSERLVEFLECLSRFHQYSWMNCMLISGQKPDATRVAGFRKWLDLKRCVRKGEKGIAILAPLTHRRKVEDDEGVEKTHFCLRGFKVVHVFDVSQTEGEDLPEFARISGDAGRLVPALEDLIRDSGIELRYDTLPGGAKGLSQMGTIIVTEGLDDAERFAILVHELAHEWVHDAEHRKESSPTVRETEAEAVSFTVCHAFGLDCSTRSSDYIQLYDGDAEVLARSLALIQRTASRIIDALDCRAQDLVAETQVAGF